MRKLLILFIVFCLCVGIGGILFMWDNPIHPAFVLVADAYFALAATCISFLCKDEVPTTCWCTIAICLMVHFICTIVTA